MTPSRTMTRWCSFSSCKYLLCILQLSFTPFHYIVSFMSCLFVFCFFLSLYLSLCHQHQHLLNISSPPPNYYCANTPSCSCATHQPITYHRNSLSLFFLFCMAHPRSVCTACPAVSYSNGSPLTAMSCPRPR